MVGVFDSGIGGITTLCSLLERGGDFVYLRDNVRYGDKSDKFITARTLSACAALKKVGVDTIVIACNTATAVAIERLRELDGAVKYIGTEPAVKPALKSCKFVTVALTKAAAEQRRFRSLISGHESRIKVAAFDRLADDIEKANFEKRTMIKIAEQLLNEVSGDGLVLGCTHYVFLKRYIAMLSPSLKLFDGNEGVAKQLPQRNNATVKFLRIRF